MDDTVRIPANREVTIREELLRLADENGDSPNCYDRLIERLDNDHKVWQDRLNRAGEENYNLRELVGAYRSVLMDVIRNGMRWE